MQVNDCRGEMKPAKGAQITSREPLGFPARKGPPIIKDPGSPPGELTGGDPGSCRAELRTSAVQDGRDGDRDNENGAVEDGRDPDGSVQQLEAGDASLEEVDGDPGA